MFIHYFHSLFYYIHSFISFICSLIRELICHCSYGAAKNLCTFATQGENFEVDPQVQRFVILLLLHHIYYILLLLINFHIYLNLFF